MGIVLGSNFDVQTALPLDSRLVVADLTARDAIDSLQRYEGMIVYVESEETNFQLVGGTANENWTELSGSGSGGSGSGLNYISGAPEVYQGSRVITLGAVPVDETGDAVTATSHGITTGQKVRYDTDGTEIGGLTSGTTYYAISATANALQFATSYENAKAGIAIDLTSDGSGTQTLTVDLDKAIGGTPTVTVEETSDVSALTYKFSKDGADRFGEGLSFPVTIDAIDFEKTRKQIVTFFYKTSADYVDRDVRVMIYDVKNETFIEVKGGLDDNGELPASSDIIEFRGYFHPASDSGNYRLAFNINSENTDAYDIYLGRVKITSEENIPVSGISPLIFGDDSHFEGTIGNWKKYKDSASEAPEDGDGGTPGIIFLRGTTKVLGGDAEGLLVHDGGSNYQGEGVALDIAVTPTNRAKDNKIQFFYSASGDFTFGGFGSNSSVMVHLYDVTNGKHLNPYPGFLDGSGFYEGYCQIPHDCETIRLILHVATNSTDAWVLAVKKFQIDIAPNEFVKADSDWEDMGAITIDATTTAPTKASGIAVDKVWRRKDGPDAIYRFEYRQTNTTGANAGSGDYLFALPPGDRIDTTKVTAYSTVEGTGIWKSDNVVGHGTTSAVNSSGNVAVVVYDETHVRLMATWNNGVTPDRGVVGSGVYGTTAGPIHYAFEFRVPIKGWTSGNLTAASANLNAPVVFGAYKSGGEVTSNTTIPAWTSVIKDSVGAFNPTTGEYTVKVPGDYHFDFYAQTTASTARASIYVNGSQVKEGIIGGPNDNMTVVSGDLFDLKYGDVVTVRLSSSLTIITSTVRNHWSMHKIETSGRVYKTRVAYLKDVKAAGTHGGDFTSGSWQTRVLNKLEGDASFVSLASNQFTLQPGTYHIEASVPATLVGQHQAKLRNITDSTDDIIGTSMYNRPTLIDLDSAYTNSNSRIVGTIILTSSKTFEIQHRCSNTLSTTGFGTAANFGVDEVYTVVKIEKVL